MMKTLNAGLLACALISITFLAACSGDDDNDASSSPGATQDAGATGSEATGGTVAPVSGASSSGSQGAGNVTVTYGSVPDLIDEVRSSVVSVDVGQGEGSGVIWNSEGDIVTNHHVVEGATSVEVVLASGERLPAEVIASDPLTDLAVIHVDRPDLQAATFSEELPRIGTLVLAIGNPLGFGNSVTQGIISGLNRAIPSGGQSPALVDLLQTDAAISPGNSGGALINANGEVVGINVAYIPPSQSAVSLGFAIPSPTAIDVIEQLLDGGTVEHSFLGIEPRPLTPQITDQLGGNPSEGVLVFGLTESGPAAQGGVETGDVIVEMDGEEIASIEDLYARLRETSPGDTVPLKVVRGGTEETLDVTLEDRPAP